MPTQTKKSECGCGGIVLALSKKTVRSASHSSSLLSISAQQNISRRRVTRCVSPSSLVESTHNGAPAHRKREGKQEKRSTEGRHERRKQGLRCFRLSKLAACPQLVLQQFTTNPVHSSALSVITFHLQLIPGVTTRPYLQVAKTYGEKVVYCATGESLLACAGAGPAPPAVAWGWSWSDSWILLSVQSKT